MTDYQNKSFMEHLTPEKNIMRTENSLEQEGKHPITSKLLVDKAHSRTTWTVCEISNTELATCSNDKTVRVWSTTSGEEICNYHMS